MVISSIQILIYKNNIKLIKCFAYYSIIDFNSATILNLLSRQYRPVAPKTPFPRNL